MKSRGFTLLETILALGVFAGSGLALIALMSAAARQLASAEEQVVAQNLGDAVKIALDQVATKRGLDAVAASAPVLGSAGEGAPLFTADRLGAVVREFGDPPIGDQFFAIEIRRFASPPLQFDPAAGYAAFDVLVSWPYRANASSNFVTPPIERRSLSFAVVLSR